MSHFVVYEFVPKNTEPDAFEDFIRKNLAPYDANIDVPEYDRPCCCIGRKAKDDAWDAVQRELGDFHTVRQKYWAEHPDGDEAAWEKAKALFEEAEAKYIEQHPLKDKPDPECPECDGSGTYKSTYNPKSQWDWYVIGGRWDGFIQGEERSDGGLGFNFGPEHHQISNNVVSSDVLKKQLFKTADRTPYAVVDLDGAWHQRGKMGWFGISSGDKLRESWNEEVVELLDKAGDCWVVVLDCHI